MKIGRGFQSCGGRKSPSRTDKAHGLYNSLYDRTSRDQDITLQFLIFALVSLYTLLFCIDFPLVHSVP